MVKGRGVLFWGLRLPLLIMLLAVTWPAYIHPIEREHGDPVKRREHTKTINRRDAYIGEHKEIKANGGAGNKDKNYNKINSPGKKLSEGQ